MYFNLKRSFRFYGNNNNINGIIGYFYITFPLSLFVFSLLLFLYINITNLFDPQFLYIFAKYS